VESGQRHAWPRFTPGTHCTGGWVGPRAGLDTEATGKSFASAGDRNPVFQSVVRRYTDWVTPASQSRTTTEQLNQKHIWVTTNWPSSVTPGEFWDSAFKLGHDRFPAKCFPIHLPSSSYHLML
jgi:hypothetical protein